MEDPPKANFTNCYTLFFQPALLARFQTVIYSPLIEAAMRTIVEMKLAQVSKRLNRHYGLATHIEKSLYDALTSACLLSDTGIGFTHD